jgi:hypothetical protein
MFTLRIWVFKSGVLKNVFILSKHVRRRISEAQRWQIIGMHSTGMADFRRFLTVLVDRRLLGSQCCSSTGLVANGISLTKRCNALSSRSDVTRGRVIKRSLLVDRHRRSRLACCLARRGWNLRTWRKSRFLLHVTDDRMRVWRHKNTAYAPRNIQPTVPYGGQGT